MIQTENVESNIITDTISMEVRTMDECLAVFKSQVKLFASKKTISFVDLYIS